MILFLTFTFAACGSSRVVRFLFGNLIKHAQQQQQQFNQQRQSGYKQQAKPKTVMSVCNSLQKERRKIIREFQRRM